MRNPGHDDGKRVVEALELLMSQVWLAPEAGEEAYADAGVFLNACRLDGALSIYREELERDGGTGRATRFATCVRLVMAAAAGEPLPSPVYLPPPELEISVSELAVVSFHRPHEDESPVDAFAYDDVTNPVKRDIPAEAYREEVTMQVELGDYELEALPVAPPSEETTRVAQLGELPLDELRAQMESESSDAALDGLLDELADEVGSATTEVSHVEPIPQPAVPAAPSFGSSPAIPSVAELSAQTQEVAVPAGSDQTPSSEIVGGLDQSWTGVRLQDTDTSFEPGVESLSDDQWEVADGVPEKGSPAEAEAMVQRGELGEALRVYQELAARAPVDARLWRRIAEVAKMLQRQSKPPA